MNLTMVVKNNPSVPFNYILLFTALLAGLLPSVAGIAAVMKTRPLPIK